MAVSERIQYLNKHRKRGDVKAIALATELKISTVYEIVTGKYAGQNAERILSLLEKRVEERIQKGKREAARYIKKLSQNN